MLVHIQILRFLAAAAVVAFHAWGVAPKFITVPAGTPSLGLPFGGHGVDLFFVISGFIIFHATHGTNLGANIGAGAFLRRRVERIVPLYFFAIAAVTALALAWPALFGPADWFTLRHVLKSLAFISFTDGEMPVVYVGWSLEYEMYFYLCVALLIAFSRNVWRDLVVGFCALVILGQIPAVAAALGPYAFLVDSLLLEFVLGVIAGALFAGEKLSAPMFAAAAAAVTTLAVVDPGNRALLYGLPSAALVLAAALLSRARRAPSQPERALARLGDASYAIYLAQVNSVSLAAQAVALLAPQIAPLALVTIVTAIVVALGLALNIAVERPLLRASRRIGKRRIVTAVPPACVAGAGEAR